MTIERAHTKLVPKPWGVVDIEPWSRNTIERGKTIGEIWFERPGNSGAKPALLLKLLLTDQPLSIQVHPDDAYAHSMGLSRGKTEAWYVLSARVDAKIALGLTKCLEQDQFRRAIKDGSIADLVAWRGVVAGDVISVPAGTIHAIGAGLVIAEIQQRSDTTFRLFDHGRQRDLHIDEALAVADLGPVNPQSPTRRLTNSRMLLATNPYFILERIQLAANCSWLLDSERETWLLVISGNANIGAFDANIGDAVFLQGQCVDIRSGPAGMIGLVAYENGTSAGRQLHSNSDQSVASSREVGTSTQARAFPRATGAKRARR